MKFSQVVLGTRAEKPVMMTVRGVECSFALRPLTGTEEGLALSRATEYATEKKAAKVEPGNSLFDLGLMLESLAIACVDTDSPVTDRTPFWDGGATQLAGALDLEQIVWLFSAYEMHQSECSPSKSKMSSADLVSLLVEIAGSDSLDPLVALRPGTLASCLRTTARLLLSSPEGRSLLTSPSPET